jgi:hypothetical protein
LRTGEAINEINRIGVGFAKIDVFLLSGAIYDFYSWTGGKTRGLTFNETLVKRLESCARLNANFKK